MSVSVIVQDARLEGRTPMSSPSSLSLDVDEGTPLEYFLNRCRSIADEQGGISTLFIMAHGAKMASAGEYDGGDGIIFCQELVHLGNVSRLSALAGKVEQIVLLICSPPATSFDVHLGELGQPELSRTFHGDGNELCRQIAIHTKAKVTGARETRSPVIEEHCTTFAGYELSCEAGSVDLGEWDGIVVEYDASGQIAAEWTNPSPWRDSHGAFRDPRLEQSP